jgi:hypothetical protein
MFGQAGLTECERKFLLDADQAEALWSRAMSELACDDVEPCYVRTTYFDTADLSFHRSSPVRRRLRVREYATAQPDGSYALGDRCYLELKQSHDGKRHKLRVAIAPDEAPAHMASLAPSPLLPCVATWYRRRALDDAATRLRVTLDDDVLLCKPRPLGSALGGIAVGDVLGRGPRYVLEIKFTHSPPLWLADAIADLDEAVGFSKFMLGMSAVATVRDDLHGRQSCPG